MKESVMVKLFVQKRLDYFQKNNNESVYKATMSHLRKGVGCIPGEKPELWEILFYHFPEELESKNGIPTRAEWAVYIALTMFALHQQGKDNGKWMHEENQSLGQAVRKLCHSEDEDSMKPIRRRFTIMATSNDIQELSHYLRGIIQLLKREDITLDYGELAEDLYWFQNSETRERVRLSWGQDFYR